MCLCGASPSTLGDFFHFYAPPEKRIPAMVKPWTPVRVHGNKPTFMEPPTTPSSTVPVWCWLSKAATPFIADLRISSTKWPRVMTKMTRVTQSNEPMVLPAVSFTFVIQMCSSTPSPRNPFKPATPHPQSFLAPIGPTLIPCLPSPPLPFPSLPCPSLWVCSAGIKDNCQLPIANCRATGCFQGHQFSPVAVLCFHCPPISRCKLGVCTLVWPWVRQFEWPLPLAPLFD